MRKKYGTVSNAEDKLGLTVEYYIGGDPSTSPTATPEKSPTKHGHLSLTKPEQIGLATACVSTMSSTEKSWFYWKDYFCISSWFCVWISQEAGYKYVGKEL